MKAMMSLYEAQQKETGNLIGRDAKDILLGSASMIVKKYTGQFKGLGSPRQCRVFIENSHFIYQINCKKDVEEVINNDSYCKY